MKWTGWAEITHGPIHNKNLKYLGPPIQKKKANRAFNFSHQIDTQIILRATSYQLLTMLVYEIPHHLLNFFPLVIQTTL